jgi:DNA-binding CsgD family transcriptional regulator
MHSAEQFWARVNVLGPDDCWEWQASLNGGYGQVIWNGYNHKAHRVAWELTYGKPGGDILHKCDNRKCCNPRHLFQGTAAINAADKLAKGRQQTLKGVANGRAILTESDVIQMRQLRADGMSLREIAARYDVDTSTVSNIVRRKRWAHLK